MSLELSGVLEIFSFRHLVISMYSEYPENIGLYHHHSEHIAALSFSVRTQPFGAQRFTGYVRKKALAVFVKVPSNGCELCREFFRRFY